MKRNLFWFAVLLVVSVSAPLAEDWPDFLGEYAPSPGVG